MISQSVVMTYVFYIIRLAASQPATLNTLSIQILLAYMQLA